MEDPAEEVYVCYHSLRGEEIMSGKGDAGLEFRGNGADGRGSAHPGCVLHDEV